MSFDEAGRRYLDPNQDALRIQMESARLKEAAFEASQAERTELGREVQDGWTNLFAEIFPDQQFSADQVQALLDGFGEYELTPDDVRESWADAASRTDLLACLGEECAFLANLQSTETQPAEAIAEGQRLDAEHAESAQRVEVKRSQAEADKETIAHLRDDVVETLGRGTLSELESRLTEHFGKPEQSSQLELGRPLVAEARARLQSLSSLAETPEEAAIFERVATTSRINLAGATADFVYEDAALMITRSELSEDKKVQALARLGVKISPANITTATDLDNALDATVDGRPVYTEEQPLVYRAGLSAYRETDGANMLRVELSDGRVREIRVQTDDPDILRTAANLLGFYTRLEEAGASNLMGESFNIETDMNQFVDASAVRKTAQVMGALLGGTAGFDGEIITNAELDMLVWQAQYYSLKGDAATGDYDVATTRKNLETLNIRRSDGSFDYEVLKAAGSFMREQYGTGSPEFELLEAHLATIFPERFTQ